MYWIEAAGYVDDGTKSMAAMFAFRGAGWIRAFVGIPAENRC